jgi:hypothetical protein
MIMQTLEGVSSMQVTAKAKGHSEPSGGSTRLHVTSA